MASAAVACVSSAPEVTGRLVDMRGQPAAGAFVAYYYSGHRFSTAHPTTYERPGGIVRADARDAYRIPGSRTSGTHWTNPSRRGSS